MKAKNGQSAAIMMIEWRYFMPIDRALSRGFYRYPPFQAFPIIAAEVEKELETSRGCVRNIAQSIGPK